MWANKHDTIITYNFLIAEVMFTSKSLSRPFQSHVQQWTDNWFSSLLHAASGKICEKKTKNNWRIQYTHNTTNHCSDQYQSDSVLQWISSVGEQEGNLTGTNVCQYSVPSSPWQLVRNTVIDTGVMLPWTTGQGSHMWSTTEHAHWCTCGHHHVDH